MSKEPLVIILLGPPGSGKGTHAEAIAMTLGIPHISTGSLFRAAICEGTPLGLTAKKYIHEGKLVPDELVFEILFDRIDRLDCANGYILDGMPRTLPQALKIGGHLTPETRLVILNLALDDETIVERLAGRVGCKTCGRPYHVLFLPPPTPTTCCCGGSICQRADDRAEVVRERLKEYHKLTAPLIAFYASKIQTIDSKKSKSEVFEDILAMLPVVAK